jgi:hypothetical protein
MGFAVHNESTVTQDETIQSMFHRYAMPRKVPRVVSKPCAIDTAQMGGVGLSATVTGSTEGRKKSDKPMRRL